MAIVRDLARPTPTQVFKQAHNTAYQKGNDNAATPTPTWLNTIAYIPEGTLDTHINFAYEAGTNNTADQWVPIAGQVFLDATPNTTR